MLYVIVIALVKYIVEQLLPSFNISIADYQVYIQILLAIAFGYLIVSSIAEIFYWITRARYGHLTAAIRNIIKIIGMSALATSIAGGAVVALGVFHRYYNRICSTTSS